MKVAAAKISTMLFVCYKRRYAVYLGHLKLLVEGSWLSPTAPRNKDCRESMSHSRCVSLVQRKILTEGRFGQEGLRFVSYSGSNADGLTVKLLKTSCCFCAAVLIETVVKLGKQTHGDPRRWREHPAAEIEDRRIQCQCGFVTAWSESVL